LSLDDIRRMDDTGHQCARSAASSPRTPLDT
jgi:hypothetical protein